MTEYSFPLPTAQGLVERLDHAPPGTQVRRWVVRDDNAQHYHGCVARKDDPLFLELLWKRDARGREQRVGLFRLYLARLLEAGYIRLERDSPNATDVRLRFSRGERGIVAIQVKQGEPALPVGMVDQTLE